MHRARSLRQCPATPSRHAAPARETQGPGPTEHIAMRDLFRFLFRQRNNLLFLALMGVSVSLLINGNMHQRAQAISSSNAVIGQIYAWRNEVNEFTDLRAVNRQLAMALAAERNRRHTLPQQDTVQTIADSAR